MKSKAMTPSQLKIKWLLLEDGCTWFARHPDIEYIHATLLRWNCSNPNGLVNASCVIQAPRSLCEEDAIDNLGAYEETVATIRKHYFESIEKAKEWVDDIFVGLIT